MNVESTSFKDLDVGQVWRDNDHDYQLIITLVENNHRPSICTRVLGAVEYHAGASFFSRTSFEYKLEAADFDTLLLLVESPPPVVPPVVSDIEPAIVPMQTITITFGRNIGTEPMSQDNWQHFIIAVENEVEHYTHDLEGPGIVFKAQSTGFWVGADGQRVEEDSSAIIVVVDGFTTRRQTKLEYGLAYLAGRYGQEAIGLAVGPNQLISAEFISSPA